MTPNGFQELPVEMQLLILNYVPTTHLLYQCRAVSRFWYENASSICRCRQVHVQGQKFYDEPTALGTRFTNAGNLPWSSITLSLCSEDKAESITNKTISEKYGYQVKKIHLLVERYNYLNLLTMLSQMPNLKVFTLKSTLTTDKPSEAEFLEQVLSTNKVATQISLPKLTTLVTPWMVNGFAKFVEFILTKSGAKLTNLNLKLTETPGQDLKSLLAVLSTQEIEHTRMSLMFTQFTNYANFTAESSWKLFAAEQFINVQELCINAFENNSNSAPSGFRVLELALSKFKKLVKLILIGFFSTYQLTASQLLRIPTIQTLETLTLCCVHDEENVLPATQNLVLQVHFFNPSDFPSLKALRLLDASSGCKCNPKFRNLLDPNTKLDTVETLCVDQYNGSDNWADVFPNLRILVATVSVSEDIQNIFKCKNLKSVIIKLNPEVEPSLILSQSFNPLPKCSKLKSLTLMFSEEGSVENTETAITDSAAMLFKLLPPLYLTLVNATISKEMDSHLRSYHMELSFD